MGRAVLILSIILHFSSRILGQCITLKGTIVDASSKKPLLVRFSVRTSENRKSIGNSTQDGTFTIQLPCAATSLIVEKSGFRMLELPISGNNKMATYFLNLELYAVDKQGSDKPYFQSEQSQLVLENAGTSSNGTATRYFKLIDVQTKKNVKGEICLLYTKVANQKCFTYLPSSKGEKVIFDQEDIIAVIVNAQGYQTYTGNLIIDKLDNKSNVYEIALSKMQTFVAFSTESKASSDLLKLEFISKTGAKLRPTLIGNSNGFLELSPDDTYTLKGNFNAQPFEQKIKPKQGLNFISLDIPKTSLTTTVPEPPVAPNPLPSIPTMMVIYFEQSQYQLLPKAKTSLDSIALFLATYPTITAQITGFTDNVGDRMLNKTLSEFRAKVAVNYLVLRGVSESRLKWYAMGQNFPAADNTHESSKALNRRVEIKFSENTVSQSK